MEKYRGRKELHCFFADLEKACDRAQERNCGTARGSLVAEKHVRVLQDMYEDSKTVMRYMVGVTYGFRDQLCTPCCLRW